MAQTIAQKFNKEVKNHNKNYKNLSLQRFTELVALDYTSTPDCVGVYTDWLVKNRQILNKSEQDKTDFSFGLWDFHNFKKNFPTLGMSANIFDYTYKDMLGIHIRCNNIRNAKVSLHGEKVLERIKGQYTEEYSDSNWLVVRALTQEADKVFGSNTSWCTVNSDYFFKKYSDEGYLICIPVKDGKAQLTSSERIQFHISDGIKFYGCLTNDHRITSSQFPAELQGFLKDVKGRKIARVADKTKYFIGQIVKGLVEECGCTAVPTRSKRELKFKLGDKINLTLDKAMISLKAELDKHTCTIAYGLKRCNQDYLTEAIIGQRAVSECIQSVKVLNTILSDTLYSGVNIEKVYIENCCVSIDCSDIETGVKFTVRTYGKDIIVRVNCEGVSRSGNEIRIDLSYSDRYIVYSVRDRIKFINSVNRIQRYVEQKRIEYHDTSVVPKVTVCSVDGLGRPYPLYSLHDERFVVLQLRTNVYCKSALRYFTSETTQSYEAEDWDCIKERIDKFFADFKEIRQDFVEQLASQPYITNTGVLCATVQNILNAHNGINQRTFSNATPFGW